MVPDVKGGIRRPSDLDRFQALAQRVSAVGEQVNVTIDGQVIFGGGFRVLNESRMSPSPFGQRLPRTELLFVPRNKDAGSPTHVLKLTQTSYESASSRSVTRSTRELTISFAERVKLTPYGRRLQDEVPTVDIFAPHGKYSLMGGEDPVAGRSTTRYLGQMEKFARAGNNAALITRRPPLFVPIYSLLAKA